VARATGYHVAEKIGASGRLIGLDPLPERVAVATEKNRYPNVEFRVGCAELLKDIPDKSIDVAYLSSVFHWISQSRLLWGIGRVLKDGGRVGLTTNAKEWHVQPLLLS